MELRKSEEGNDLTVKLAGEEDRVPTQVSNAKVEEIFLFEPEDIGDPDYPPSVQPGKMFYS